MKLKYSIILILALVLVLSDAKKDKKEKFELVEGDILKTIE